MEGGSTERIVVHLGNTQAKTPTSPNRKEELKFQKPLLDILACPACKGEIQYDEAAQKLVCVGECQRRYPIREGIPVMLIDEAEMPGE